MFNIILYLRNPKKNHCQTFSTLARILLPSFRQKRNNPLLAKGNKNSKGEDLLFLFPELEKFVIRLILPARIRQRTPEDGNEKMRESFLFSNTVLNNVICTLCTRRPEGMFHLCRYPILIFCQRHVGKAFAIIMCV